LLKQRVSLPYTTLFSILVLLNACHSGQEDHTGWKAYGGSSEMIRYSSLRQIDTSNVNQLQLAWSYSSGDADTANHSQIQCNPIMVNGTLYGISPQMNVFALDAGTGKQKWIFNPQKPSPFDANRMVYHIMINSRGLAYWTDGKEDERLFFTAGSYTYAINARTGIPIPTFGDSGYIDLHQDLDRDVPGLFIVNSSPGIVYKNLLIMGSKVDENTPAAPGHIRAYDVLTGKRKWIFHTIPHPGEFGYETWMDTANYTFIGGANVWSGFALDEERGILFAPTGSAVYDFYGGRRKGQNLFANCLLALNAETGERIWHFQFMHHDVWDKDLPTPPALITIQHNGKKTDAVAQPTKNGMVYVFDRETGKPIFDVVEVPVDTLTDLPGEKLWPTQPLPVKPLAFSRQKLTLNDINPYLPETTQYALRQQLQSYRFGNMFVPPGKKPSIIFPGFDGGAEWGGPAFDPETGVIYINANEMAWVMEMLENKRTAPKKETIGTAGKRLYALHCQVCHAPDRKGTGNNPTLIGIEKKLSFDSVVMQINSGRRMMPAFQYLPKEEKEAIAAFILNHKQKMSGKFKPTDNPGDSAHYMPYLMKGYTKFLSPEGYPAISPPWGTLNAIDLNDGSFLWKVPLGEYEEFKSRNIPATGTENYGGPVVTAGGLVFIAASRDGKMRAFNKFTGKLLWEYQLPAPGFATPAVYDWKGKQYLVIACGGGKLNTRSSDQYLAFALP
jgi:quinoprotein glucose dehydrogenase